MVKTGRQTEPGVQLRSVSRAEGGRQFSHLITEYAGQYLHIQIASLPDRHEPDEGEINHPWLCALLDKTGYDGWIGCEYIPGQTRFPGLGRFSPYRKKINAVF